MILRSTLGPNLKGKLKFRCILCTNTFMMQWNYCKRAVTQSFTDHEARPWPWRLSRLMPDTVDEMCVGANIFAFARNTVCVHRRLQWTGIPSYHRQQMRSRMHRRAFVDASTFTDASANVHMYTQLCADRTCPWTRPQRVCVCSHTCSRKHPHPHISAALSAPFPITLPSGWREGRWDKVVVTPVRRNSTGPVWQLKLDMCWLPGQATATKAYNRACAISWPSRWTLVSFCHFWKTGRLISLRV